MPPKLIVEVIGDVSSLTKAFGTASAAGKKFTGTVSEQARKAVDATVKQRENLEGLAAEYKRVAAAAKHGSAEERAALHLAADATRKLEAITSQAV